MKTTMTMKITTKKKLKELQLRHNFVTQEDALLALLDIEKQFLPELNEKRDEQRNEKRSE